ncbi:PREDICTED: dehydrogenase/reductase SDR family member 1-like [Branchiostoma belcheri]|uniref:Dehydrogenase/reductase SDR family member 1-like n=1 Tax=Branchiostoma belcheri TaxID=7741 RepID=A0A6P4ZM06_BRABE|nr:PREDICTED: dehydrogenase/reductase SDR family member 1-like [Branchiostoma belcheri]
MNRSLVGKVAIVVGASRGIGKGIALQLAEVGATVYITGRTLLPDGRGTSLTDCAEEIKKRGGRAIPIQCDLEKDDEVKELFERVSREQNGRLDIVVNSAFSSAQEHLDNMGERKSFWDLPLEPWTQNINVGVRGYYTCTVYAARLMVPARTGLIVNMSSEAGLTYLYGFTPSYCVSKMAADRLASDCAQELREHGVTCLSLWPGATRTERVMEWVTNLPGDETSPNSVHKNRVMLNSESNEYAGKTIVHLASDPDIMKKSGRIFTTGDLADAYGFKDIDGRSPPDFVRRLRDRLSLKGYTRLAAWVPSFVKIPNWMLYAYYQLL